MKGIKYLSEPFDKDVHLHGIKRFILSKKTKFQEMMIVESYNFGKMLILDGWPQSAQIDEHFYHESLVQPAMFLHNNPKKVLILGGGEGATLREVLRHKSVEKCVMVDIDGDVIEYSKQHLAEWSDGAFDDPRAEVLVDDAIKYVQETKEKFDVVLLDLTDPEESELARIIFNKDFLQKVKNVMNPEGVGAVQCGVSDIQRVERYLWAYKLVNEVFVNTKPYMTYIPAFLCQWGFTLFSNNEISWDLEKIEQKSKELGLRFYDKETHTRLFSRPRHIRDRV